MNRFFLMLGIALAVVSCNNDGKDTEDLLGSTDSVYDSIIIMKGCNEFPTPIKPENIPEKTGPAGTKWKLVGILDVAACELHIMKMDCEECYTISFDTDFIANGKGSSMPIVDLDIRKEGNGLISRILEPGSFFTGNIAYRRSYIISKDELRIISDNLEEGVERHVIFKLIEP